MQQKNKVQALLHNMGEMKAFYKFKAIFETIEGIIFGTSEVTSGAPHIRDSIEIKRYMSFAVLALMPATIAAVYFYGLYALAIIMTSYVAGGITEVTFAIIRNKEIEEGFLVTGLIFALVLPPTLPLWAVAIGSVFGVFFGKEIFGGTGRNIFNPALVGRLFITIAFPQLMSSQWRVPFADAITSATPLGLFKTGGELTSFMNLLFGLQAGSMGELFRLGIIVGGILLMITKVSNWRIPVTYLGTVFILSFIGNSFSSAIAPPVFSIMSGGLLFGAMFMATDPVTSPSTKAGKFISGFGCGVLTFLIRSFSGYTEGVMFSIIFMNGLNPLIDHAVLKIRYRNNKI
ncbi:MAG: RnfABCDGE type electron transport complex subunit D [Spirochaetaceae bacterium]|nr:RnfABCDGE type electron transport complex subunit D [Spirochaetaceae bacterium]